MAKLEEIAELLTDEINGFNQSINKLEKINDQISTTKIRVNLAEYNSIIKEHEQRMKELINSQEQFENRIKSLLKNAKVYPIWAVIIFIITFIFGVVSTTFIIISKQDTYSLEKEAYKKGVRDTYKSIQPFFETHPKFKKAFEKWEGKIDKEN